VFSLRPFWGLNQDHLRIAENQRRSAIVNGHAKLGDQRYIHSEYGQSLIGFLNEGTDNHDTRTIYPTFNMLGVIRQGDITHGRSTLANKARALHI
jgi:hypothetical protein